MKRHNHFSFTLCSSFLFLFLLLGGCVHGPQAATTIDVAKKCDGPFNFVRYPVAQKYDLVFEGGGAKGTVFVGAVRELENRKIAGRRYVGTSAGAITAALLAAGYTADEMLAAVNEKTVDGKPRFTTFMDIPERSSFTPEEVKSSVTYDIFRSVKMPAIPRRYEDNLDDHIFSQLMTHDDYRKLFSFVEKGGLYEGQKFVKWMEEKLDADCRNLGKATLKSLYDTTGSDLTVVASNVTKGQKLVLNKTTAPQLPVAWAVRMSMSIPFIWQEVRWKEEWGAYNYGDEKIKMVDDAIVDGGVLSNFPLNLVTSNDPLITKVMPPVPGPDVPKLGLIIDESLPVPGVEVSTQDQGPMGKIEKLRTAQRVMRLINTMTDGNDNLVMQGNSSSICRLPAKGYGTTEFDMSDQKIQHLVNAGSEAMKSYFTAMETGK